MKSQPPDCFLSFVEVAQIIGLDETTIRNYECGTGELLRIKLGSRTVFSFLDVQRWMAKRVRQAQEAKTSIAGITLLNGKTKHFRRQPINKSRSLILMK